MLGTLADVVAPYECERLVPAATHTLRRSRPTGSSPHENYQECYHCPLIHPELCRVSPPLSGDNYENHTGAWVGGTMDLAEGAATMSLDGRSGGVADPRPLAAGAAQVALRRAVPEPAAEPPPRLRDDAPGANRVTTGTTWVECQWLFPPEAVERPDFDPVLRRRLLGPHQPPGLGGGRERAAGPGLAGVRARRAGRAGGRGVPASSRWWPGATWARPWCPGRLSVGLPRRSRAVPATGRVVVNRIAAQLGEVGPAGADRRAGRPLLGRRRGRRRPQRPGRGGLPGPGRASRCWCSSGASGSAAPARSSGPSPTSATWCRPAPTWSACSTSS